MFQFHSINYITQVSVSVSFNQLHYSGFYFSDLPLSVSCTEIAIDVFSMLLITILKSSWLCIYKG